jgi:pimeloyl-ACP methyl ester carboxylesterase
VRQFPLWVPTESGPVATVVTVPDDEPRGIVLALAGTGRHIAIGSTMSARLSERIVEHGLASVRFDYTGVGDSPGTVASWSLSDVESATRQALAVMESVGELLGTSRFAIVGTCYGSRVVMSLVGSPSCIGAVCLAPPVLEHAKMVNLGRSAGHRRLHFVQSNPLLRRTVYDPLRARLKETKLAPSVHQALEALNHAELVFVYSDNYDRDHFTDRARDALETAVAKLPADRRARFALHVLATGALTTFEVLPTAEQDEILDLFLPALYEWFDRSRTEPTRSVATV